MAAPDENQSDRDRDNRKNNPWVQAARYSELALMLPAALVVGWLIGTALDHWLHTTWLSIVFLFLGIIGGLIQLIRTILRDTK